MHSCKIFFGLDHVSTLHRIVTGETEHPRPENLVKVLLAILSCQNHERFGKVIRTDELSELMKEILGLDMTDAKLVFDLVMVLCNKDKTKKEVLDMVTSAIKMAASSLPENPPEK